jgi:3(or 17)beta-hydroxysteroid dehydrogenase
MSRLKTKICIVTGAGRGIGAAIAQAFAREGATVVVTDKNEASAADVAREIGGHHLRLDVASEADWTALAEAWPACDVLVNNAGITGFEEGLRPHDPEHASLADWRAVHAVNLDGTFLGCRYAIGAIRWARSAGVEIFYFSSFDEAWKVGAEGDVGAYWGLWDTEGKFKYE